MTKVQYSKHMNLKGPIEISEYLWESKGTLVFSISQVLQETEIYDSQDREPFYVLHMYSTYFTTHLKVNNITTTWNIRLDRES